MAAVQSLDLEKSVVVTLILSKSDRVKFDKTSKGCSVVWEKFQIVKVDEKLSRCVYYDTKC